MVRHFPVKRGSSSKRKVSITVQLSEPDEYEGGDLEMWQGGSSVCTAARGAGVVFIFPSYMMHRVTKVTKGTRRSFVLWVGGQHYKYNKFFHSNNRLNFLEQLKRDEKKENFCEMNKITLVRIIESDELNCELLKKLKII